MEKMNKFLGKRILAGIIDYGIIFMYFLIQIHFFGVSNQEGGYTIEGFPAFSVFVFWVIMTIGLEQVLGATIGNILNKIKPSSISDDGLKKISLSQSVKRHLLDLIDMSFFGLVGIILINTTKEHQRLGDLWAKTKVVKI